MKNFPAPTERLSFRIWRPDDIELALSLWGDPEVMKYLDVRGGLNREQVREKLEKEFGYLELHGTQYWPVFEAESGDFVGCSGLKPWAYSEDACPEIGFHLVRAKWGRGYAKEMALGVIDFAREHPTVEKLMVGHHPENEAAAKIVFSLGFVPVKKVLFPPTGLMHPAYELRVSLR